MKSEVIIQKAHRFGYERAVRNCGVRLVEVETAADLERAVTSRTAMLLFYNNNNKAGRIQDEEFVHLGAKLAIPTLNDAAADVPPVENLWKYTAMGFDLVAFSGGKGMRGPQSAGLLVGRKALVAAARQNGSPNGNAIGRGMKVNKEELVGMLAAVERFVQAGSRAAGAGVRSPRGGDPEGRERGAERQGRSVRARGGQPRAARTGDVGRRRRRTDPCRGGQRAAGRRAVDRNQGGRRGARRRCLDDAAG